MLGRALTTALGIGMVFLALLVIKVPIFAILKTGAFFLCFLLIFAGICVILASFIPEK